MTYEEYCIKFPLDLELVPEIEKYHDIDVATEIKKLHYESYLMYLEVSNVV